MAARELLSARQALARTGRFGAGARIESRLAATPARTTWLVRRSGERFVLRVDGPLSVALGLDRRTEWLWQRLAWRHGLAPEPVLLRTGRTACLVSRFAPGRTWTPADLRDADRVEQLAQRLSALHALPLPATAADDLGERIAHYGRAAKSAAMRTLAQQAAMLWRASGRGGLALCHRDPLAANVAGRRPPLLIDWEYAGPGDPAFDLAAVLDVLPAGVGRRFLSAYAASGAPGVLDRLVVARQLYVAVEALWQAVMRASSGDVPGR